MYVATYTWTVKMVSDRLAKGELTISAPPVTPPDKQAVVSFFDSARLGLPLGTLILAEPEANRFEIVDGFKRIAMIARVTLPDLFGDGAHWPVTMLAPDHPSRPSQLAWGGAGMDGSWVHDPATFPLSSAFRTVSFLTWERELRNRTPDDERIKSALNAAHALAQRLLTANITVCVIRGDGDGPVDPDMVSRIRQQANARFGTSPV